jgi:fructose-bisphosphate aldolase class 1
VKEQFDRLGNSPARIALNDVTPDTAALPGVVLKTETAIAGRKCSSTVVSVNEETLDAALFDAPKEYREIVRPAAPTDQPAVPAE